MKAWILLGLIFLAACATAQAARMASPLRQSQQFTVFDSRPIAVVSPGPLKTASGEAMIKLDADVLLLSAERIREGLLVELGASAARPGKITLVLYTALKRDDLIGVVSTFTPSGWEYRVEIPDQLEAQKLVRGIVHALLLEMANRGQGPKPAELPLWLVEGLTANLLSIGGKDLVVGSVPIGSMLRIFHERRGLDYLQATRETLRARPALDFAGLAYPRPEQLVGENLKTFQSCAHLFVYELLRTRQGPAHLRAMLQELPRCWNWEIAFLRAFSSEFKRMLDVEKKWSVDVLAFTERDPSQVWSRVLCLERLDEVLSVPAQVRTHPESLPERKTLTFQQVITNWEFAAQSTVLQQRLSLLQVLLAATRAETNRSARLPGSSRLHASVEMIPVIEGYHQTVATYLHKRALAGRTPDNRMQTTLNASLVAQEAIRELELLDRRREALRPENVLSGNSPITR